tara:strand:- start:1201 stop:1407 length:207 start_codon:yes stop_codon:yes gene_type:complete
MGLACNIDDFLDVKEELNDKCSNSSHVGQCLYDNFQAFLTDERKVQCTACLRSEANINEIEKKCFGMG